MRPAATAAQTRVAGGSGNLGAILAAGPISAQQLGALLDVLVTYDHRMIDAALAQGLPVTSPA